MQTWQILLDVVVLLAACLILGALFARIGLSALVGFLFAGMILGGPGSLGVIRGGAKIESIAELGVALLLFSLGLEFSWRRLRKLGAPILFGGAVQVAATGALAAGVGMLLGLGSVEAIALGMLVSLSSTAAVLRLLIDGREIDSLHGRNAIAILLVQDIAVVPLAVGMSLLVGGDAEGGLAWSIGRTLLLASGFVLVLWVLLHHVARRMLVALGGDRNRDLVVILAVVVGLGSTWAAHSAGLSPALGAFLAGMILGSSPFATQVRADVSSLRVVLLTLFFGAVGMLADPIWILNRLPLVLAVTALLIVGKTLVVWAILRVLGRTHGTALATGLCLAQVGEFAFVLATTARAGGVISEHTDMLIVSVAIVSLLATAALVPLAPRVAGWIERRFGEAPERAYHDGDDVAPLVVVIGFGPAGCAVATGLSLLGKQVRVVDLNEALCRQAVALGFTADVGDARQIDVLEHARIDEARSVVITLPTTSASVEVLQHVKRMAPAARRIVRSRYAADTIEFETEGAHLVVGDEEEVGRALSRQVLDWLADDETKRAREATAPQSPS